MNSETNKTVKSQKALCWYHDNLVMCSGNKVYVYNPASDNFDFILKIPFKNKFQILRNFSLANRFFRLDISYGYYSQRLDILFLCCGGKIYEVSLNSKKILSIFNLPRGSRPLYLTEVKGIHNINDGMYFGEYFNNTEFKSVYIYTRKSSGIWESVYEFANKEIYHIHNIIPDKYRNCLWVFTGDLDEHCGIWKIENNFTQVAKLFGGEQKYRACTAVVTKDALIYGTDTPMTINYLCKIFFENSKPIFNTIETLEGSVIYGTVHQDSFIFSTTVEPGVFSTKLTLNQLLNNKRGKGIKSDYCKVMIYNTMTQELKEVISIKKDKLPFYLFQFGAIMFPSGKNSTSYFVSYNVGLLKNDCKTEILKSA